MLDRPRHTRYSGAVFRTHKTLSALLARVDTLESALRGALATHDASLDELESEQEALKQAHTHWGAEMATYADQIEGFLKRTRHERLRLEQFARDQEKRDVRDEAAPQRDPAFDGGGGLFS